MSRYGPKMTEFEFGPFWIYSVSGISNTSLHESTYWQVFYPIVTKISTFVDHGLRRFNFENGVERIKKVQFGPNQTQGCIIPKILKIFLYGVTSHQKVVHV